MELAAARRAIATAAVQLGGRNIGDAYFEAASSFNYGDMDAIAIGAAVPEVSSRFDRFWNSPVVYGISELHKHRPDAADAARLRASLYAFAQQQRGDEYAQDMRESPLAQELRGGTVSFSSARIRVTADDPAKVEQPGKAPNANLLPQLMPEFAAARDTLVLVSPYFVPGKGGVQLLKDMRTRGVRVKILTNGIASTDQLPVFGKYKKYRRPLLEAGIEVYEVNPQGPHDPGAVLQTTGRPATPGAPAEDRAARQDSGVRLPRVLRRVDEPRSPLGPHQHRNRVRRGRPRRGSRIVRWPRRDVRPGDLSRRVEEGIGQRGHPPRVGQPGRREGTSPHGRTA